MSTSGLYYFKSSASFTHLADATLAEDPHWPESLQIPFHALPQLLSQTGLWGAPPFYSLSVLAWTPWSCVVLISPAQAHLPEQQGSVSHCCLHPPRHPQQGLGLKCRIRDVEEKPPWEMRRSEKMLWVRGATLGGREESHTFVSLGGVQEWVILETWLLTTYRNKMVMGPRHLSLNLDETQCVNHFG